MPSPPWLFSWQARRVSSSRDPLVLRPLVVHATVCKEHLSGDLVDVDAIGEAEGHAIGLIGQHRRLAAARPDTHQPLVRVGDVEVAGLVVEAQAQRTAARALCDFRWPSPGPCLVVSVA